MSYGELGIPKFEAGQRVVADDLNIVARNAARSYSGDEAYVDATGVYPAMNPAAAAAAAALDKWEWGKLDGALASGGTATMSVWRDFPLADTGNNITVDAPPLLTTGSLASGSWVWAQKHSNGAWYVMGGQC